MAALIPGAANLREIFISPISLRARLPARTESDQAIRRVKVGVFRRTATAKCMEDEGLALHCLFRAEEDGADIVSPRTTELNKEKVFSCLLRWQENPAAWYLLIYTTSMV